MKPNDALRTAIMITRRTRQIRVARDAKIHEARFSKIINGYLQPSDDEKRRIAKALRMPVSELFGGSEAELAS